MAAIGLSVRELAAAVDVSESHPRRWAHGEKPVPLALLFADGVPHALTLGIVDRVHARRGTSSPLAALRAAAARVERAELSEAELAELRALHVRLGAVAYGERERSK